MKLALKILFGMVLSLLEPIVTLVYRRGWFDTPDDNVSPRGMYEERVRKINERFGNWVSDYYWLALRNRAYGYDYAMKPEFFKNLTSYDGLNMDIRWRTVLGFIKVRTIWIEGFKEYTVSFGFFHVIYGYRLRPIFDESFHNKWASDKIPFRPINMDARPILSFRFGAKDD
jgi:hypothetical protein